ncbi:hypothetical protein [Xylanibacter caecicola]|uniref:hypothetical protein n=1 Tax=Xylanibacter caecicola TaxID=2736294 RepID=UPI00258A58CD|nr:hypothetical protein [Xylanibacter caecicola]
MKDRQRDFAYLYIPHAMAQEKSIRSLQIDKALIIKMLHIALQKMTFQVLEGHLLQAKTPPFRRRNATF